LPSILRFGSLCFVYIPKETRSKANFETTKAVERRILGQEDNVSGRIVRLEGSGKLVRSGDVRVATGATVPATQQAPIYRPDRSQQDEQIDLGETLQDLDDEKQEEKDRSRSAGTPFSEEHDGQYVEHQLKPRTQEENLVLILVHLDDFVIATRTTTVIQDLLKKPKGFWKLSEMGEVSSILGMKVTQNRATRTAWLTQPDYIDRLLERFPQHLTYRIKAAPLLKIAEDDCKPTPLTPYQEIIGSCSG
jgi:hypothetical protein